jgi:hypothetical protein
MPSSLDFALLSILYRPAKKGASSVVQKKRADPLLLDGEDDEEEIEVVPQKPSLKAKAPLKKAKATEKVRHTHTPCFRRPQAHLRAEVIIAVLLLVFRRLHHQVSGR